MKTYHTVLLCVLLLTGFGGHAWAGVPRMVSYQGRLTGGGDGPVDLTFTFYDAETGGNVLWSETHSGVSRSNGLFTVQIGPQTTGGIPDEALDYTRVDPAATGLWLGVTVNSDPELFPRTQVLMVPYAAKAEVAEGLVAPGTFDSAVTVNANGDAGIGTTDPRCKLHLRYSDSGQTPDNVAGLFVENDGVSNSYYVFQTATSGGGKSFSVTNAGNVGIGIGNPKAPLDVQTTSGKPSIVTRGGEDYATATGEYMNFVHWNGSSSTPRMCITPDGDVGIGTTTVPTISNLTRLMMSDSRGADITMTSSSQESRIWHYDGASPASMEGLNLSSTMQINFKTTGQHRMIIRNDGRVGIGTDSPDAMLDVNGAIRIRGADLAERFDVSGTKVEPGMLVSIDPDKPGALRVADQPYDLLVAGVVSGAGGVRAGLILGQDGTIADGETPVAVTGRVWCLCDADAGGPIRPGDLLTSSTTPGHAMRADTARDIPRGCIIGKAMTKLENGTGLVLMLVQPQ